MSAIAKLIATDEAVPRKEIPLRNFPFRLGRRTDADVCVEDRWVSRDHCEIVRDNNGLLVRDLDSKHGTFVNGHAVKTAALKAGDELSIGLSCFVLRLEYDRAETPVTENALV